MFQYAVSRKLATELGLQLRANPIDGFPETQTKIDGLRFFVRRQRQTGHRLDPIRPGHKIIMDGLFQRIEYLPEISQLRKWFHLEREEAYSPRADLALSVRRGWNGYPTDLCPSQEYYFEILKSLEFRTLRIFTDSPDDTYFTSFLTKFPNTILERGGAIEQFRKLSSARRVIMAPSTFTFWATYLGNAEEIFWPQIDALNFREKEMDWFPRGDSRVVPIG